MTQRTRPLSSKRLYKPRNRHVQQYRFFGFSYSRSVPFSKFVSNMHWPNIVGCYPKSPAPWYVHKNNMITLGGQRGSVQLIFAGYFSCRVDGKRGGRTASSPGVCMLSWRYRGTATGCWFGVAGSLDGSCVRRLPLTADWANSRALQRERAPTQA